MDVASSPMAQPRGVFGKSVKEQGGRLPAGIAMVPTTYYTQVVELKPKPAEQKKCGLDMHPRSNCQVINRGRSIKSAPSHPVHIVLVEKVQKAATGHSMPKFVSRPHIPSVSQVS